MRKPIPRISTRGYYDLKTGKTIKNNNYFLYPKKYFENLYGQKEITIMIHGLRNNKKDAANKFEIAKKRLKQLGYKYPVIGFSYDSNTKGAHLKKTELQALKVGQKIAQKNGRNLSKFIMNFKNKSQETKIRLIGHSLGTELIMSTIENLSKNPKNVGILESIHLFGSSINKKLFTSKKFQSMLQKIIRKKIINYYAPSDEVLLYAQKNDQIKNPLGTVRIKNKHRKFKQNRVFPINHRFLSYSKMLKKFP